MNLLREKEFVNFFHYDARNFEFEKEQGTPETKINVQVQILDSEADNNENTKVQVYLNAMIVLDQFVLSSALSQVSQIEGKKVEGQDDLSHEEMQELSAPLFDLLKRLTYEVTEVALDMPGLKLEF